MGLETAHVSNTFALNDGRALSVIVRSMALWSSMCSSIEGVASKRRQIESNPPKSSEPYIQNALLILCKSIDLHSNEHGGSSDQF